MAAKALFTLAALASVAFAQDAQTTLTIPFGDADSDGFVASVQAADACDTTLLVGCASTGTPNQLCALVSDLAATAIVGPTGYEFRYSLSTLGGTGVLSQTCEFMGTATSATGGMCTPSVSVEANGQAVSTSAVLTFGEGELNYAAIAITAGADKLPSAGATCTATAGSAGSGTGGGGAVSTGTSDGGAAPTNVVLSVVKVLVPVAAVAGALI